MNRVYEKYYQIWQNLQSGLKITRESSDSFVCLELKEGNWFKIPFCIS